MFYRSQPRLQAQVDLGAISCLLEHFQLQGAMCLGASAARYGEVGRYFKYRYGGAEGGANRKYRSCFLAARLPASMFCLFFFGGGGRGAPGGGARCQDV